MLKNIIKKMKMKILTYNPKKTKQVLAGVLDENNTFIKKVTDKQCHKKLNAYTIQEDVLQQLIEKEVKIIRIVTPKNIYETKLKDWLNGNKFIFIRDYGHGKQRFFPICFMNKLK